MWQQRHRHAQHLHPHPWDPTQLSQAVMSPTAQTALSTKKSQLDSQTFMKADSAGSHSCLLSATGTDASLLTRSHSCWGGHNCSMGPQNRQPSSAWCAVPSRFALTENRDFSHLIEDTQGPGTAMQMQEAATRALPAAPWLLQAQTTTDPQLLTLLSFSLLFSPDVSAWCNPRNNTDKFLACYFWPLLPPREEGDHTAGYSGELAHRPQTHVLARTVLMINPGQAEQFRLQSVFGRASAVLDYPPMGLEGAIYLLSIFNE